MVKSILDIWVSKDEDPFEEILALMEEVKYVDLELLWDIASKIGPSMVDFWKIFDHIYNSYEDELVADTPGVQFKSLIEDLNFIMVSQFKALVEILNASALDGDFVRLGLEKVLEESNLMAVYDRNNIVQSLLQYGNHILVFNEGVSIIRAVELEVEYGEPLKNRMAGRKVGKIIKELAYKTSNEILVHAEALKMDLKREAVGKANSGERYKATIFNLICAWALHWSLLSADSLYIYTKAYQIILDDNSTEV